MKKRQQRSLLLALIFISLIIQPFITDTCAEDISSSTIDASPSTVYSLKNSTITVTVEGTGGFVSDASVGIAVEGGQFPDSGTIYNATTDATGVIAVDWKAPVVNSITVYNFTTTIISNVTSKQLTTQVTVNPLDFSGSTIEADPSEINETEETTITVTVDGTGGVVEGAEVLLVGIGGAFDSTMMENSSGLSDSSGKYSDNWIAPDIIDQTNFTITASVAYVSSNENITLEQNITVNPVSGQIILNITTTPSQSTIEVGQIVEIEVTTINDATGLTESGIDVTFEAVIGGLFQNGNETFVGVSDSSGKITAQWDTSTIIPEILGTDCDIDITAGKIGLLTNKTTLSFLVTEVAGDLDIAVISAEDTIDQGDSVVITVTVTVDSVAYQGATVNILAQSGVFVATSTDSATAFTNAQGKANFTWDTSSMAMVGIDPVNYTFTISVSILPIFLDVEASHNIIVIPAAASTPPGSGGPFYTQWWFFAAVGGGIVAVGTLIILLGRKK